MSFQTASTKELLRALLRAEILLGEAEADEGACTADPDGAAPQDDPPSPDPAEALPSDSIASYYRPLKEGGRPWEPISRGSVFRVDLPDDS